MANNKANRKNIKTKGPKKKTINNEIYAPKFILSSFDIIVRRYVFFVNISILVGSPIVAKNPLPKKYTKKHSSILRRGRE